MQLREELARELTRRDELRERVTLALATDQRVERVELMGSLQNGKHDEFSDIDLLVHLERGESDRAFFFDLPPIMETLGPVVAGWGFQALPGQYVATFHFDDYPLFWGVDIGCVGERHEDAADLVSTYRWEQIYKMWILAAKYVAIEKRKIDRGDPYLAFHSRCEQLVAAMSGAASRSREQG